MQRLSDEPAIELDLIRVKGRGQPTRVFTPLAAFGFSRESGGQIVDRHSAMLRAYRGRDWDGADAALAACQERASVLAHERDRARAVLAELTASTPGVETPRVALVG